MSLIGEECLGPNIWLEIPNQAEGKKNMIKRV